MAWNEQAPVALTSTGACSIDGCQFSGLASLIVTEISRPLGAW